MKLKRGIDTGLQRLVVMPGCRLRVQLTGGAGEWLDVVDIGREAYELGDDGNQTDKRASEGHLFEFRLVMFGVGLDD